MKRHTRLLAVLPLLALAAGLASATAQARGLHGEVPGANPPPPQNGPQVYVTGQGLAYDSIVLADLPNNGPFQKLEMDGPTGLQTEFGPGDHGYVGGRWWVDANPNGEMDDGDVYFLCPLLGPGYVPAM
jgi:hypothetical protein